MGCGNSRGVSSGIFIHMPSNTPRSWSTQYLEKKKKTQQRDQGQRCFGTVQPAGSRSSAPDSPCHHQDKGLHPHHLFPPPPENLEVDWMLHQRRNKAQMLQSPSSGNPSPAHKERRKKSRFCIPHSLGLEQGEDAASSDLQQRQRGVILGDGSFNSTMDFHRDDPM